MPGLLSDENSADDSDSDEKPSSHRVGTASASPTPRLDDGQQGDAGATSSEPALQQPPLAAYSRQALVLAFGPCGASQRQRETSWAGVLPSELYTMVLQVLPVTPEYCSIVGLMGTVQGSGIGAGPGQFKNAYSVYQVCFGSVGTVWVADLQGHRVHHFKQSGEVIKTIGTGTAGNASGELKGPVGMAVSHLGSSIFIVEYGNNRISEFNQADGAFVRVLDTPGLVNPNGMCLSPDETRLAVACDISNCIKVFRMDGSEAPRTIGGVYGSGDGQLDRPWDVRFTADGQQLVVADYNNSRVQVLGLDGSFVRKMPLGARAHAVAVDAVSNIIAATDKHVKVFSPEGTLLHDRLGGLEIGVSAMGGLAIDPASGKIAVGDSKVGAKVYLL